MRIVTIASQSGGAGKSTLAANLACLAAAAGGSALLFDTDPVGPLLIWQKTRGQRPPLVSAPEPALLDAAIARVREEGGVDWIFIDTPPQANDAVAAAMRAAALVVIPTRADMFDLASVPTTIALARRAGRPHFVALNGVPPKHGTSESPIVQAARRAIRDMGAPVWRGTVASRAAFAHAFAAGQAVTEFETAGPAADEMRQLWGDVSEAAAAMAQYRNTPKAPAG